MGIELEISTPQTTEAYAITSLWKWLSNDFAFSNFFLSKIDSDCYLSYKRCEKLRKRITYAALPFQLQQPLKRDYIKKMNTDQKVTTLVTKAIVYLTCITILQCICNCIFINSKLTPWFPKKNIKENKELT